MKRPEKPDLAHVEASIQKRAPDGPFSGASRSVDFEWGKTVYYSIKAHLDEAHAYIKYQDKRIKQLDESVGLLIQTVRELEDKCNDSI